MPEHEREITHPTPAPAPTASVTPTPAREPVVTFTVRGTEVVVPAHIADHSDFLQLALDEIDNAQVYMELAGWIVEIVPPTEFEGVVHPKQRLFVRWRTADHEPKAEMLPSLRDLVNDAIR